METSVSGLKFIPNKEIIYFFDELKYVSNKRYIVYNTTKNIKILDIYNQLSTVYESNIFTFDSRDEHNDTSRICHQYNIDDTKYLNEIGDYLKEECLNEL